VRGRIAAALILALSCAVPAAAQGDITLYGTYASTAFTATESFEAVSGNARHPGFGGGIVANRLWRGVFLDVGMFQTKIDGERVFVDGTSVYKLGIPLQVKVTPIDLAAGWRLTSGRFSSFLGAGMSSVSYKETGDFFEGDDNVSVRKSGPLVLAGVDVAITKWVQVGAEIRYRAVKGILGSGGASGAFGEKELGGTSGAVRMSVGR
jgi:opacity protein-like surface antigen